MKTPVNRLKVKLPFLFIGLLFTLLFASKVLAERNTQDETLAWC